MGKNQKSAKNLMTTREVCHYLKVSRYWIYRHVGEIPHFKIGNVLRFDQARIENWLDRHRHFDGVSRAARAVIDKKMAAIDDWIRSQEGM